MALQKRMMWTGVATVAALMLGAPSVSSAQDEDSEFGPQITTAPPTGAGRRGPGQGDAYTPAAGAKDLKSVLFNWAWHMGMLRSTEEYDLLMSLVYQGTGTVQVGGQPCKVTMYRSDISYQKSGERVRITGTRPNGQSCNTIEVLSGAYTWNEDIMAPSSSRAKAKPRRCRQR